MTGPARRSAWVIAPLLLAAIALPLILFDRSLWSDEASSVWFARLPLYDLIFNLCDPHPPGYYLLLKMWLTLGQNEFWLRLPSLFAAVTSIALTQRLGRDILDLRTGRLAALLLVTFPFQSWYAAETRMYALVQALGVALLWSGWHVMVQLAQGNVHRSFLRAAGAYYLVAILALSVDYTALLPFGLLQLFWLARGRPGPRAWLALQAATLTPLLLWRLIGTSGGVGNTYHAIFVAVQANRLGLSLDPAASGKLLLIIASVAIATCIGIAWTWPTYWRRRMRQSAVAYLLMIAWLLLLVFAATPRLFTVKRLLVVILPALTVLAAYTLSRLNWPAVVLAAALGLVITLFVAPGFQREPWRKVIALLTAQDAPHPAVAWVDEMVVPAFDYYARQANVPKLLWTPLFGHALPALPELAPPANGALWLVTPASPYRDLHAILPDEFHMQYYLEQEYHLTGIGLWRYRRRLPQAMDVPPKMPTPSPELLWGLELPSPLAPCR